MGTESIDQACTTAFYSERTATVCEAVVLDRLIYLGIPIFDRKSRNVMRRAVSDGTEVGCVRSGATKSAGTLSIEI